LAAPSKVVQKVGNPLKKIALRRKTIMAGARQNWGGDNMSRDTPPALGRKRKGTGEEERICEKRKKKCG